MWRNYLAAALQNLFRNRAYAAINIVGLAIGFTAAILIGLYVRDELSYDRQWPNWERVYRVSMDIGGSSTASLGNADGRFGPAMALDFPEVEAATRLRAGSSYLKHGDVTVWADYRRPDPNFFELFPARAVAGDPDAALHQPDTLVVTRLFAQRLFGRENVVGEVVDVQQRGNRPHRIGAVVEELPSNTHFRYEVLVSTIGEAEDNSNAYTYVRFRPGTDLEAVRAKLPDMVRRHLPYDFGGQPAWKMIHVKLTPLRQVHFLPPTITDMDTPSDPRTVEAFVTVGLVTLLVSAGNFISMMTARAARRAVEVGVRKAAGATRAQLVAQFVAEGVFYAGLALLIAVIAVELLLPALNGFLQRRIAFDYLRSPALGAGVLAIGFAVAAAACIYPAAVLSRFRPASVLKGVVSLQGGPGRLRSATVSFQFGVLVTLIVATLTIHRQTRFATEEQLRVDGDQIYLLRTSCTQNAFQDVARRIPGVRAATCTSAEALGQDLGAAHFTSTGGAALNLSGGPVEPEFFAIFNVVPIAGRLVDDAHGEDNTLRQPGVDTNPSLVVNVSGARALGYANPADAVGRTHYWSRGGILANNRFGRTPPQPSQIVGIVPDFTAGSIRTVIQPSAYYIDPRSSLVLALSLDGRRIPETLQAIHVAWKTAAAGRPMISGQFLSQVLDELYLDIRRQTWLFAAFSSVAVIVASLGLLGLAVFTAERRTREIGVRKCLGASRGDILRFIGWQFARPVLIANLIAWPVAWILMRRWLEGFAYHIEQGPTAFVLASALAVGIALLTVSGHALVVSRSRPVEALRYE